MQDDQAYHTTMPSLAFSPPSFSSTASSKTMFRKTCGLGLAKYIRSHTRGHNSPTSYPRRTPVTLRLPFSWTNRRLSRYCGRSVSKSSNPKFAFCFPRSQWAKSFQNSVDAEETNLLELRLGGRHFEQYIFGQKMLVDCARAVPSVTQPRRTWLCIRAPPLNYCVTCR